MPSEAYQSQYTEHALRTLVSHIFYRRNRYLQCSSCVFAVYLSSEDYKCACEHIDHFGEANMTDHVQVALFTDVARALIWADRHHLVWFPRVQGALDRVCRLSRPVPPSPPFPSRY